MHGKGDPRVLWVVRRGGGTGAMAVGEFEDERGEREV